MGTHKNASATARHHKTEFYRNISRLIRLVLIAVILSLSSAYSVSPANAEEAYCQGVHRDVSMPLTDLGPQEYIRMDGQHTGFVGGLYPGGSNIRPAEHEAAGIQIAQQITPLNAAGQPDPENGLIVMTSIGMSNTFLEFVAFEDMAAIDPQVNPQVKIVNGAQAGRVSSYWVDPDSAAWEFLDARLAHRGVAPEQVQVVWIKLAQTGSGAFPDKALSLQAELVTIVQNLKINFPNVKIAYMSSRTRSYTYWSGLSPEPAAFENGFAVKWLIESQIDGDPELNYDPELGPAVAPYLTWSAYLWADGINPRSDGLVWTAEDLMEDCTHPSSSGEAKIATLLMDFFKHDATTSWFTNSILDDFVLYLPLVVAE